MLSPQQLLAVAAQRRPLRSLREQYDLYILDRIEHYKNSISRDELMRLADEALSGLGEDSEQQYLFTEVLVATAVDELIKRRLGTPRFESWKKSHPKRRAAQRDPAKWGLDQGHLIAGLAPRVEPGDPVLVVGSGAEACAYLLAAHDATVTFLANDIGAIDRAESRISVESLSSTFEAMYIQFGDWLPDVGAEFVLVVVDAGTLAALSPGNRRELLAELQRRTAAAGLHALVPDSLGTGPEGFAGHYAAWQRESLPSPGRRLQGVPARGALFVKPAVTAAERQNARA
ncbi:MAG: hypothetical protein V4503_07485 [Gemmatimonadota bacterium]